MADLCDVMWCWRPLKRQHVLYNISVESGSKLQWHTDWGRQILDRAKRFGPGGWLEHDRTSGFLSRVKMHYKHVWHATMKTLPVLGPRGLIVEPLKRQRVLVPALDIHNSRLNGFHMPALSRDATTGRLAWGYNHYHCRINTFLGEI